MLAIPSRRSYHSTIQYIIIIIIVIWYIILLTEGATQIGIKNVVATIGRDGSAHVRTNDDVNILRLTLSEHWSIFNVIGRVSTEPKESEKTKKKTLSKSFDYLILFVTNFLKRDQRLSGSPFLKPAPSSSTNCGGKLGTRSKGLNLLIPVFC
jgi:hypothetical protein